MKRLVSITVLVGFLVYTGSYVFVYLFRAFRIAEPADNAVVRIWHGDPMIRAVLVAVLFCIGLVMLLLVLLDRDAGTRSGSVRLRSDLSDWIEERADSTSETPDAVADRAVASYRAALEGGRPLGKR